MVLLTVLMIVSVIMVLSLAILSQNITQSTTSQKQVEDIRGEELAKGEFFKRYSTCLSVSTCNALDLTGTTLGPYDGKTYTVTVTKGAGNLYNVAITY